MFKYYLLLSFLFVTARIPMRILHGLAWVWGATLYTLPNRARDTTLRNLRACFPDLSNAEISRLAKESLTSTASTAMEMGKSWMLPIDKTCSLVTQTEGLEEFKQAAGGKQGIILLAPHLSNWEIFGLYVCQNIESTFMYQPPKLPALDRLLQRTRSRGGMKLAPADRKGVSMVLKALQRGEMVGVLPDQVPNDEGGEFSKFFGEQALTMTLVSKLVARSQARVFCGFVVRLPKGKGFKLTIREADQAIYDEELLASVRGLNKSVEDCVLMAVEQYQWEYKRFRRQPDGKKFY
ncbi:MAG: lysophospholipid acyltransferase family protein [Gammaproteobacteria bacterium]|nr:lysophospholipid acyltransferase family protein [Gammaproteobacteria bacterium]